MYALQLPSEKMLWNPSITAAREAAPGLGF